MRFTYRITGDSATAVMESIAGALEFPDYFGHNLDALYDCLTDLSWLADGEHVVVWSKPKALREADPQSYSAIAGVLADAVADGTGGGSSLALLLRAG